MQIPLAERMRPQSFETYIGQEHITGPDAPLRKLIEAGFVPSILFWGPPGTGKTTLAKLIAKELQQPFHEMSAVHSGVKEVRECLEMAARNVKSLFSHQKPILFIDEIHRFNKSQQDSLLHAVEKGDITLIGATTENPGFEVINALLSRCQVFTLKPLDAPSLQYMLEHAVMHDPLLKQQQIQLKETDALIQLSGGDGRKLLNLLEMCVYSSSAEKIVITNEAVRTVAEQQWSTYDKNGEMHYDIISAFIKSIRGSDPQAALYWLGRMINGGEDVKFIGRRLLILAAEDIGLANPNALVIAQSTFQAVSVIGMPESSIILSQCTIYLATSPKSNSAYLAINKAIEHAQQTQHLPVPLSLRNAPHSLMKSLQYGQGYQYSHDYPDHFVYQEFMPEGLSHTTFYESGDNLKESEIKQRMRGMWGTKYSI
jgi:putative ATPase